MVICGGGEVNGIGVVIESSGTYGSRYSKMQSFERKGKEQATRVEEARRDGTGFGDPERGS